VGNKFLKLLVNDEEIWEKKEGFLVGTLGAICGD
jgi:hypothetical protein